MLELVLYQHERICCHVGVKQCTVPVISFAAVEHQPIAHRGKRLAGSREKLREQNLRANVPLFSVGALAPLNHLGAGNACTQKPRALIDCHPPHMRRIVYAHFPSWQAKVIHWQVNNLERG
jgi:hypothetical protein